MNSAWTASAAALSVGVDPDAFVGPSPASNVFTATAGAQGAYAEWSPTGPLDLSSFDEIRFWLRADREADGGAYPFYIEFSYRDAVGGTDHRWYVPVNESGKWEHRRIGIASENRSAATRFRFSCLDALPVRFNVDELIAWSSEPLADVEDALVATLARTITLPGLSAIPLAVPAVGPAQQLVLSRTPALAPGNRIIVRGGSVPDQLFDLALVTHDTTLNQTTVQFSSGQTLAGSAQSGTATVDVIVPVFVDVAPNSGTPATPAIEITAVDVREDLERTSTFTQRDSFRDRGGVTVCSARSAPRAYAAEYQITIRAFDRSQELAIHTALLRRVSTQTMLRVGGEDLPMLIVPPPPLDSRDPGTLDPVYVRIGMTIEVEDRNELVVPRRQIVGVGPRGAPRETEWRTA